MFPEAGGSRLMGGSDDRNVLAKIKASLEQLRMRSGEGQNLLEFFLETMVRFPIAVSNIQNHAIAVVEDAIVGIRQIFAGQPEIHRMARHRIERHFWYPFEPTRQCLAAYLSAMRSRAHLNQSKRVLPVVGTE